MFELLFPFAVAILLALLSIKRLIGDISDIRRLGGFDGYWGWVIAGIIIIFFVTGKSPFLESTVNLDDLQVTTGILDSQISVSKKGTALDFNLRDSYFLLSGSGDDKQYWNFTHCGDGKDVIIHCKGKPINVWYKGNVVYQVATNGNIIYSVENSNLAILIQNIINLTAYILICLLPIYVFAVEPRAEELREMNAREKFDKTLTNETLDEDHSGKILRRFCKNCGAELGERVEDKFKARYVYNQYRFCANCGLDSDPNMPVKSRLYYAKNIAPIPMILLLLAIVNLAIDIADNDIRPSLLFLVIVAVVFGAIFLIVKFCPNCGRPYEKENFCPNCGRSLNRK